MAADTVIISPFLTMVFFLPSAFEPPQSLSFQSATVLGKNEDRNVRYFIHRPVVSTFKP
jgi:hypothetical protein